MTIIKHTTDLNSAIYTDSLAIRKEVFVTEQHVPIEIELDTEDQCTHFVLYNKEHIPQATVRFLAKSPSTYKVQRMAVIKSARKKGYGKLIMTSLESLAKKKGAKELILGAQLTAIPFYESLGYHICGDEYLDADIKHKDMKKYI